MPVDCQTRAGAAQFTGAAGAGQWTFTSYDALPRTTRVVLSVLGYHAAAGGSVGDIAFYAVRPGGAATERVLLGRATAAQMTGPGTEGNATFCGKILPREPGGGVFWQVIAVGSGKDVDASACLDFLVQPYPDTSPED